MKFILILFFCVFSLSCSGCTSEGQKVKGMQSLAFFNEYAELLSDSSVVILDGRTEAMFSGGHLPNAVNLDADHPDLNELLLDFKSAPKIVVYCTTIRRTGVIVRVLKGFYNGEIFFIEDGIRGWQKNELPLVYPQLETPDLTETP